MATPSASERRRGDWIQTHTGRQFWPLDPRADEIDLEDIAHALAQQCRFGGHTQAFYSVAQHSLEVECELRAMQSLEVKRWALLHDATEAYLVDVPRPVKGMLLAYQELEARLHIVIAERFRLPWPMPDIVHHVDGVLLATEMRDLMGPPPADWEPLPPALERHIEPLPAFAAKRLFLERAAELEIV